MSLSLLGMLDTTQLGVFALGIGLTAICFSRGRAPRPRLVPRRADEAVYHQERAPSPPSRFHVGAGRGEAHKPAQRPPQPDSLPDSGRHVSMLEALRGQAAHRAACLAAARDEARARRDQHQGLPLLPPGPEQPEGDAYSDDEELRAWNAI